MQSNMHQGNYSISSFTFMYIKKDPICGGLLGVQILETAQTMSQSYLFKDQNVNSTDLTTPVD